jgi:hypothetical protein
MCIFQAQAKKVVQVLNGNMKSRKPFRRGHKNLIIFFGDNLGRKKPRMTRFWGHLQHDFLLSPQEQKYSLFCDIALIFPFHHLDNAAKHGKCGFFRSGFEAQHEQNLIVVQIPNGKCRDRFFHFWPQFF